MKPTARRIAWSILAVAGVAAWVASFGVFSFAMLVFMTAFEVLVAFLQAYIFTILTAVYISGAMHPEH